ncbi:sigma-54 interaction domain-containing protein [Abyssisolibacter fermentans]|uniref:sigma-54 interaction domain-containing protein n=1 Tax=Abyssisolibacter fermentans TaxID=1766203 RepID=UPI00082DBE44|nr:sigma 54-interacting transcriptional regulator [Abyssisolibacter fermentans]
MTNDKNIIEIDNELKQEISNISQNLGLSVNDFINKLVTSYKSQINEKKLIAALDDEKNRVLALDDISNSLYDGLYIADGNGVTIDINKAFTRITGISKEQVIGQHLQTLIDRKFFSNSVTLMVLEQKKQVSTLCTIIHNNKKVLLTGNPIFNEKGEITLVITNVRDITELINLKQRLEASEEISKKYHQELELLRNQQIRKSELIGDSFSMRQLKELIHRIAGVDATVLITGETGVGKEVVAREIYINSHRKKGPFIKVNCAAIPENLLESELFGYEKGAFTGALNKAKLGMFELSNSGIILLDEIGDLPIKLQSKLLRVLQDKEVTRIGGTKPIKLDTRVIAATNRNLQEEVKKGKFREDLFYRLNVIPIQIPPLRSRKEDIPLLVRKFIDFYNKKYNRDKQIDLSALEIFDKYNWPGNVRELENYIERLVVTIKDKIIIKKHLLNIFDKSAVVSFYLEENTLTLKEAVDSFEKQLIKKVLKKHKSTREAAKVLGVSQPTIVRKVKSLGIETK